MGKDSRVVRTDVLVIGAGAAGIRAAIEAKKQGVETLLVVKGGLGESGSTFYPKGWGWGFQASLGIADKKDTPGEHLQDILEASLDMCDESLAEILAREAPERIKDLIDYGLEFDKRNGEYVQNYGCFNKRPRAFIVTGMDKIRRFFTGAVRNHSIRVMQDTMVVDLILQEDTCVGAVGVDARGQVVVFEAKSVVMATGGGGNLFLFNLNTPDITGDGQAIAFRAGAELANLEFFQIGFGVLYPVEKTLFEGLLFRHKPRLYNGVQREFIKDYLPSGVDMEECFRFRAAHMPFSTRDVSKYIDIASFREVIEGRSGPHGGILIDLTNVSRGALRANPSEEAWWSQVKARGFDPTKELMEVTLHVHALNGGLRINERTETNVPGLYAAGEVAAGPHGADRPGGNMMPATQVFGARAGEFAAKRAKSMKRYCAKKRIAEELEASIQQMMRRKGGVLVKDAKDRIQKIMWENVLVGRREENLAHCLSTLSRIEQRELPELAISNMDELFDALALPNMVQLGKMMVTAARARRESRGSHHRDDYPKMDKNAGRSVVFRREGEEITYHSEHL